VNIRLTEKGGRIARAVSIEPMEIFRAALQTLSARETRDLLAILTKVARAVQAIVKREVGPQPAKVDEVNQ
jgi:DNA-binding MarR family transcriptional regulator